MNHYCLCCEHCPDDYNDKYDIGICKIIGEEDAYMTIQDLFQPHNKEFISGNCEYYTPRPEPQFSHCKAVLKMLGVEVEE